MALLVHYHTATRETIVPVTKRRKTGDDKFMDPLGPLSQYIEAGKKAAAELEELRRTGARKSDLELEREAARREAEFKRKKTRDGEFGPPADHAANCKCAECRQWWGRDSVDSKTGDAAWKKVRDELVKTADASEAEIDAFITKQKAAGKTPEQIEAALKSWTADHAKTKDDDDDEETADSKKTTDAALDLGLPVNREWLMLSKTMSPAEATIAVRAKFTPAQFAAWKENY
jgi:hypothetical protein